MNLSLSPDQQQQVLAEIRAGRTITAIKLFREFTACGLKEAKDAVDRMAAGLPADTESSVASRGVFEAGGGSAAPAPSLDEPTLRQIETLLRSGNKIQAIKVWRDRTGGSLSDGKAFVENLQVRPSPHSTLEDRAAKQTGKGGCLGVIVVVCSLAAAVGAIAIEILHA